jgi:hypothetical protein
MSRAPRPKWWPGRPSGRLALVLEYLWRCGEDGMAAPPAEIGARFCWRLTLPLAACDPTRTPLMALPAVISEAMGAGLS